ncbi:zinc finger C3H1 domain-containing [Solea senegalensis]|uniref:Zinc finger C3H1 domain-containing n=1 Tax=Solea senegalensis TaxID=28829 RepID=A0AAV6PLV7_SOLSE|nr:zinc finger C3H1 domain-containing protein-like isoform X1 [Solea senegalensis]KAG7468900.1 zinc finger C3H1 domain-containing [Solea senegalensis]
MRRHRGCFRSRHVSRYLEEDSEEECNTDAVVSSTEFYTLFTDIVPALIGLDDRMEAAAESRSPREEEELEDGEICDDEADESVPPRRGDGNRPPRGAPLRTRKLRKHPHNMLPRMGHQPPDFRLLGPYSLGAHGHGPFPPAHRQQCGPSGPDRPLSPPLPPPPPVTVQHGEPSPRSSFWERSHGALGRFRHRGMTNGGHGAWNRGNRDPVGRFGFGENHGIKTDSLSRKQKPPGRNHVTQVRKVVHSVSRSEDSVDESFEDLLSKYRQIQLELECIRKEETMALEPKPSVTREGAADNAATRPATRPAPEVDPCPAGLEEVSELETSEKKVFQAFNIKPLRQRLALPAHLGPLKKTGDEDTERHTEGEERRQEGDYKDLRPDAEVKEATCSCCEEETKTCSVCRESSASSEGSSVSPDKPAVKVEEEELSELQLRLLALQSASKKWQQKEQQVMKKSKDRITRASQDQKPNPGPAATPPGRRVATRFTSSAASATERNRTRDRDRSKTGPRPPVRERERPVERARPKQNMKPGLKTPPERGHTPGRPHTTKKMVMGPGSAAKQALRKQQLRTWKLQQQRQLEEKRRQDEEERRRREDEIRRIRDLSNQDEQYNRFMKLVGGTARTRSKSRDCEHRKSTGKPGLDTSGNLYQYDNYDEVAMDTDSETGSPVPSPTHSPFRSEGPGCQVPPYGTDVTSFGPPFPHPLLPGVTPPPPPLPPPPDELEPPPKPPFADEEEEEEMLLRETCLMSMANKRLTEEKSVNGPASPVAPPSLGAGVQLPSRGNLSTVSLNTVSQPRSNKFSRGSHAPRAPLVLPRHKAVVVSLNDSDDSDSDMDACSATHSMFGGLEFMIKEARRTVEAAKPKGAPVCEKENNPLRTPEALPEAKKAEYRQLKEEIASREKQKMIMKMKDQVPRSSISSVALESVTEASERVAAEVKLREVEQRLCKNRELLQRDEAVLRHLLQQELKKRESLKASEAKVVKLREQLQASEKIASANRTLLKKLQEQVHRVEHRVSIKKGLAVRLEQEVSQAQLAAGRGTKRRADSVQTTVAKRHMVDGGSERHFAELIAQKQRLQQLESEYALKIQRLKKAQALRNRVPSEPPSEPLPMPRASTPPDPNVQAPPPSSPFPVPQPSLHDLTQDKLTLDNEDVTETDDPETEPAAAARGPRRQSLRQSSSFTKPHLEQLSSAPPKDISKPTKTSTSATPPAETFAGLDLEALKLRYQQQASLRELLQRELLRLDENMENLPPGQVITSVDVDAGTSPLGSPELRPVPFGPYHSPLLVFRSYRFSPYYRTKEKLSLSSVSYSNTIQPRKFFCRFDLTGTCNDDDCRWQHMRNCTLTGTQLFQDLLSYDLSLIGCCESSCDEDVSAATEKYMKKLFGTNKDRMGVDQKAVLLVSKVNESRRHVPPFTTCKDTRRWRPKPSAPGGESPEDDGEHAASGADVTPEGHEDTHSQTVLPALDMCVVSPEDKRYFVSETDDISNLESSVLESPGETQLWIKLAFKYLSQGDTSAADGLEAALNTLSRALERNCDDPEVWCHYLSLFSRRGSREEVQEMCEMAVEHAPDYRVWWNYLTLESSFEGKDYVCERLLQFLTATSSSPGVAEKVSFQLMEALLYRADLSVFTGRVENALAVLQNALKSPDDRGIADHLTVPDRALVWLSFIHLTEFERLPCSLYEASESGPSRLVSTESFLLPWRKPQDIRTPSHVLIALFQDAISQCRDESQCPRERTLASLPLHLNLVLLYKLLHRYDEALTVCESLLQLCPDSCSLRADVVDLHLRRGDGGQAVNVWLQALAECPDNAEVFYHCCRFLVTQGKVNAVAPLFRGFVLSLLEDEQSQKTPVDVLRHILGFPSDKLLRGVPVKKDLQEQLSQQRAHLHLIHCRWQWLHGSVDDTVDAFERALGSALKLDQLHTLWMDYLEFSSSQLTQGPAHSRSRVFADLVQRCLSTVPTRLELPFNTAEFWSCYQFHNKVISFYLSLLPQSQHSLVLERLRSATPTNTELNLRLLCEEYQEGNLQQVKLLTRLLSSNFPRSLSVWKLAIAVETELQQLSEVRLLYQHATRLLPLSAELWTHRLLFEAADDAPSDRLRRLVDCCEEVGVSLVGGAQSRSLTSAD